MRATLQDPAEGRVSLSGTRRRVVRAFTLLAAVPFAVLGLWLLWTLGNDPGHPEDPELIAANARGTAIVLGVGLASVGAAVALGIRALWPGEPA